MSLKNGWTLDSWGNLGFDAWTSLYSKKAQKNKSLENKVLKNNEKGKGLAARSREMPCENSTSERPANGARWGWKTIIGKPLPAPHMFHNSFRRATKFKLWPIRPSDGEPNSKQLMSDQRRSSCCTLSNGIAIENHTSKQTQYFTPFS